MSTAATDVFLSYSRTDAPVVRQIQAYLKQAGLATFLDRDQLPAGQPWLPALEQGIARCAAVAVLVGPAGLGTWQQREVQLALDRQAAAERAGRAFPVIPILLPKIEDLPGGFLRLQTWVDLRADLADPTQLHLLLTGLRGHAPADGSAVREALCPYRGLLPFREEDAGLFFGREDAIDTLLGKICEHNLVTLVGRSGSGKSSVAYAGLIPALRRRADGRTWSLLSLRPGSEPLHALVRLFDPPPADLSPFAADERVEEQVRILRTVDDALGRRIRSLLATAEETGTDRLLLYVDQWEELYTQALHHSALAPELAEREVTRFIDLLLAATRTSPCTVILTVRADFYGELLKHGPLAATVPPGLVNLGPLDRKGLAAAIRKPAEAVGLTVDPPLLEALVDEVCNDLGKLPLLEYVLKETWRRREGQCLTLNAYGQAGGIDGAVAQRANQIFTSLSQAQQAAARHLFVSLVTPGEGREDTRASAVYPEQDDAMATVINKFSAADARLLVTGEDVPSIRRLVEISHEALIREWNLLQEWIETNREALRRRDRIRARMHQWEEQGRDPSLLLPPGLPLEEGRKLLADPGDVLIDEVQPYIAVSAVAAKAKEDAAQAAQRRHVRVARLIAAVMAVLALVAIAGGSVAWWQWGEAQRNAETAQLSTSRVLTVLAKDEAERGSPATAVRLALAALPMSLTAPSRAYAPQAEGALLYGLDHLRERRKFSHEDYVFSVAFSPDGRTLATGSQDKTARLWEVASGKQIATLRHEDYVFSVAFSPDGRTLATGSQDKTARLWEVASGKQIAVLRGHENVVVSVAFSPDGRTLATGSADTARLWEVASGKQIAVLRHRFNVLSVTFSPDGRTLATGSADDTARLWKVASGKEIAVFRGHEGAVWSVAFSPDGRTLATGSFDTTARLWEVASGTEIATLHHEEDVWSVAFSPDGRTLATGSYDKTARLWEVASGTEIATLHHEYEVLSVAFSPDGRTLATGSEDNTARLWEVASGKEIAVFRGHEGAVKSVAFSPDGHTLATGSMDNTARLWEVASGKEIAVFRGHEGIVWSVAFSPDGHTLATGSLDTTARLWEVASGKEIAVFRGHKAYVLSVAFSPDGRTLATGSQDNTARLWEVASGTEIAAYGGDGVWSVAFSPDGRTLATGSQDKTTRLWEVASGTEIAVFRGHEDAVFSVAFSPDGRTLATGSKDATARLWEVASGTEIAAFYGGNGVVSVAFSPDGRTLATGSKDATARLWEVASDNEIAVFRGHEDAVFSVAFSPDGRTLATGSYDKTTRLWEVASGTEIGVLSGHEESVLSVAFSPDGRTLATGSQDKTARLWEVASGTEIATLHHEDEVLSVAFSPDGHTLATGSWEARLWPLGQRLIDLACARVHFLTLSERDKQRFGIENEWCAPEVSAELRAKLGLDEPETSSAFGTPAR